MALVIAIIGAAMMPKTETTIRTEKKTLVSLSVLSQTWTSESCLRDDSADACDVALPEKLESKPESQSKTCV